MKNKKSGAVIVLIAATCMLALSVFPMMVHSEEPLTLNQRIVLWEDFVTTSCPSCGKLEPNKDMVWNNYGPSKMAMIEYHAGKKEGDPWTISETNARALYYFPPDGLIVPPTTFIDGSKKIGGWGSYSGFTSAINPRLAIERAFTISVTGDLKSGNVTVGLTQDSTSNATDVKMRYALVESDKILSGSSDPDETYHHVVRAIPTNDTVILPLSGTQTYTKTVILNTSWNKDKLAFVAFLQSDTNQEVLQAFYYGYAGTATLEVSPLVIITVCTTISFAIIIPIKSRCKDD